MNVSFGAKVPIAKCQIQNEKTGKYESAVIYEIDCNDESDIDTVTKPESEWKYAKFIQSDMQEKIQYKNIYSGYNISSFYILENQDGETLGMSEMREFYDGSYDLTYLDTKKEKQYKYVGQTLLATTAREAYKKGTKVFTICSAVLSALDFYTQVCGFKDCGLFIPTMQRGEIPQFVRRTENRTKAPILDFVG